MTSKIEDIMTNSFMFVLLCPFIACIFALPIYELCIALIYKNDITTCSTTIPGLDISTWLIVKAVVTICALIAVVPCLLIDKIIKPIKEEKVSQVKPKTTSNKPTYKQKK